MFGMEERSNKFAHIAKTDGARCRRCFCEIDLIIHHRQPIVDGGEDHPRNIDVLCGKCHKEWHRLDGLLAYEEWIALPTSEFLFRLFADRDLQGMTIDDILTCWRYSRFKRLDSNDISMSKLMILSKEAEQKTRGQSELTKAGLARARRNGTKSGKPIGRPALDAELADRIQRLAFDDPAMSKYAIAKEVGCDRKTVCKYLAQSRLPEEWYA